MQGTTSRIKLHVIFFFLISHISRAILFGTLCDFHRRRWLDEQKIHGDSQS